MVERYTNVQFEFVSLAGELDAPRGIVILRVGEMVLEVECPDDRPYLVRGKAVGGFFRGRHEGFSNDVHVEAKWIRLDDIYIGTWLEEGRDYLFRFRLPSRQRKSHARALRNPKRSGISGSRS